jgi:hypothetical protein
MRKPKRKTADDPVLPQIRRAAEQMSKRRGGQLWWLTRFIREDSADWRDGEAADHGLRLLAIAYPATLVPSLTVIGDRHFEALARTDVEELHAALRDFLRKLVSAPAGKEVLVPTDELQEWLMRANGPVAKSLVQSKEAPPPRAIWGVIRKASFRTTLFQAVKQLVLAPEGERLVACKGCGEPTLALRRRRFCTTECGLDWHNQAKLEARKIPTASASPKRRQSKQARRRARGAR